ncbi:MULTISPECIES: NAD(P)/FAD-dependent oxidoreductase [Nocardia]|uniref:NAD(P)/FAD-dependent oxidoreductase n=1 Tax=Nocardia TaxID=1817 RepID=UPI000BEF76E4|nr:MULTISPECIES: NAD(P)/FAD-dependent oxidoreductase [Nocardia]MBF6183924.1 NAD(P)/FAD-dependent oxidoreductase [Nocardia farcinica]MBF6270489.1 NAD(P)/FAD-dependent oxidoreductase [Nocardia farcinica]MBF6292867.1 NAD(P)/FAD-dependent oxidoreductase [Nocardia farcinica]MBF6309767.1 NAD(P)/FAD-dependent oxidoreductase [Nocardia farcinica]MBF6379162.1 NAD(P)/FAD-dependent oxidoreductase [Nocardia farcinica]
MYDVIVVGTRVAGAPLAMLLARKGYRVLAVDRATFPSDTPSTHYIHQAGLGLLKSWGLLDAVVATGCPPIRHLNFSYTDIHIKGFADPSADGIDAVYCPRRTVLDEVLVEAAGTAGAEVIQGFSVTELVFEDDRVVGIRGQVAGGAVREFRARLVVGADGANSVVAKAVDAQVYEGSPASCFIYYSYYEGFDWGMQHRTGFGEQQFAGWPTNDGRLLVAVMRKRDRFREFRADPDAGVQEIVDQIDPELGALLRDKGTRVEPFRPMLYPDNYRRRSFGPGWALVGDAGYHKDPFTGWGITDAFKYAQLLADRADEGLSGDRPLAEALAEYERERDAQSASTFELTLSISELTLTPYYDSVFRATSMDADYTKKFFGLIAGIYPPDKYFGEQELAALYEKVNFPEAARHVSKDGVVA